MASAMDTLPQEIFDAIFSGLHELEQPVTARFKTFARPARQAILDCRLVQRRWYESRVLETLFVWVLEETPFVWNNHRLPTLEAIGDSWWGNQMRTLSICGMDMGLIIQGQDARWGAGRDEMETEYPIIEYLVHLLHKVSWVEKLRYYTIHPKYLDQTRPNWEVSKWDKQTFEHFGYPPLGEHESSWYGVQKENDWIFKRVMGAMDLSGLWIDTVEMPLFGNRAPFCAVETCLDYFPGSLLRRVAVSITHVFSGDFYEPWLDGLTNLEYLEISLSWSPELIADPDWNGFLPDSDPYELTSDAQARADKGWFYLPKMKEFRLMSDNRHSFSTVDLLVFLSIFPNLGKLAFAHVMLDSRYGGWIGMLGMLSQMKLDRLWLLDPREIKVDPTMASTAPTTGILEDDDVYYHITKYDEDEHLYTAAQDARLIDTNTLFTEHGRPEKRKDYEYPGFAVLEEN